MRKRYGIDVVHVIAGPDYWQPKNVGTLCPQWHCIEEACSQRIKTGLVLRTDVWDVVFQDDPRKYIDDNADKIVVCHEGVRLADEPCNRAWIRAWGSLLGNGPAINSGLICAPAASLAVLARIIKQAPLGTRIDQSEVSLIAAALPGAFEYRPGFLETLFPNSGRSIVIDGKFCDRDSGKPWCVVHGNGPAKQTLDEIYPVANYP